MSLGNNMFKGMVWSSLERVSVQAISFILGIVLARLLTPTEYGTVGLLIVFISFSQVFIDSGFSKALIHRTNRSEKDISTVFIFNILVAILSYLILYIFSPIIADFYEINELTSLLRILSISLLFNALVTIPQTLFTIELNFKAIAKVNFVSTIISGLIAVYLAYIGYGAWALVYQTLIKSILTATMMFLLTKFRPIWIFSLSSFYSLWNYGSKILASSLLNNLVNNFYALFIAKLISTKDLGYYTRGTQFSDTLYGTISSVFDNVLLPSLSTFQDQREFLISKTRVLIRISALIIIPIFLGLSVLAEPIIRVLLTDKWLMAVPIMQILCIARMITIISGININLLYVIGRTDLALRQQYAKIAVRVILLIAALPFGIIYIAFAELAATTIHFFINTYYPGKIMKYGAFKQLKDISQILFGGLLMVIVAFITSEYLISNDILKLLIIPIESCAFYYLYVRILKIPEYFILVEKIKYFFKKNKNQ